MATPYQSNVIISTVTSGGSSQTEDQIDRTGYLEPVRLVAVTSINIGTGGLQIIDGVQTVAGNRILLTAQVDGRENGVYDVAEFASWARSEGATESRDIAKGVQVRVQEGATKALTTWEFRTSNPVIGVSTISVVDVTFDIVGQAAIAQAAAAAAAVSETNAGVSAVSAAAARDAALLNGTIYADEPTGRAAVADNTYFKVIGSLGTNYAVTLWKRLNAGASTQYNSFPSYEYVQSIVNNVLFKTDSALRAGTDMAALLKRKVGYLWVANDRYSVFSDAGATVLANPGDYCPVWQDLSGRANHFLKNVTYNAPVLREDARGVRYFEFVGSTEDRTLDAALGGNSAAFFAAAAIRAQVSSGTNQQILVASDATTNGWTLGQNNGGGRWTINHAGGTTVVNDNIAGIVPSYEVVKVGEIGVFSGGYDGTRAYKWKNGHRRLMVPATYSPKAGTVIRLAHNIQNSVGEGIVHLYAACVFAENLTMAEQQIVNRYMAAVVPQHGRATSVISSLKNKIELGSGDVTIVSVSDSLGDSEEEYFYPFAAYLAERYPAFSVTFQAADYTGNAMFGLVTIQVGTNGRTIALKSFAQSGGLGRRYFADRYGLITALGNADLLFSNVGKNYTVTNTDAVDRGDFLSFMEQFRATYPACGVAAIMQPPNMLDDEEDTIYRVLKGIMTDWRELYLINAADPWKARGRRQSDYQDPTTNAIHPNNVDPFFKNGAGVTTQVIIDEYEVASVLAGTVGARFLATTTAGLLLNPKFASWPGAVADNWIIGSGTVSKDTVIFDSGTYSMKIVGASSYVYQDIDATALTSVTVFGRTRGSVNNLDSGSIELQWLDAGNLQVGNVEGSTGDGGSNTASHSEAFCHTMIAGSLKPTGATKVRVRLRGGATGGWFNDISVVAGNKPMTLT